MYLDTKEKFIDPRSHKLVVKSKGWKGFTLVELLVVISIISILMGILLPALGKVRHQAKVLMGINNQRQIVLAVNFFAMDNDDRYPESTATTTEFGSNTWYWQEPMMMTACYPGPSLAHRSISAYLHSYIADASIMFSPSAPAKYKYLQQAWDAGDDWDNPESTFPTDSVSVIGETKTPMAASKLTAAARNSTERVLQQELNFRRLFGLVWSLMVI